MGIDLNTIEEEEEEEPEHSTGLGASTVVAPDRLQAVSVCLELWHACAGPRIWLPKRGSLVMYLPQGHLEHLGFSSADCDGGRRGACRFDVPPHVFCRVVDVNLHADAGTDEVYARLSLVPESEELKGGVNKGGNEGEEDTESVSRSSKPHMFCKTLTASDTSTHGGFSVPRRAAEDCFPPLDYNQQRPSQELTAKDLHGTEWRFRHIYRGQPRRHLLTTGWSAFVNRKKLISGDAVLFLRGDDGVLRLGVRRAAQSKGSIPVPEQQNYDAALATLAVVASAVSMKKVFHINYNPRASTSEFVIPYWKFIKSLDSSLCVGMSFKMLYENDDASERRPIVLITGISDIDPQRWPGSKWKCLSVNWDDDVDTKRQNRISPWEIESTGSIIGSSTLSATGCKKAKLCLPPVNMDYPILNGNGCLDLREFASFHKVLQGQELMRLKTSNDFGLDAHIGNIKHSEVMGHSSDANGCIASESVSEGRIRIPHGGSDFSFNYTGFREPAGFLGVLQGQEVLSKIPPFLGAHSDAHARSGVGFDSVQGSHARKNLPSSVGNGTIVQPSLPLIQASSPSSVLMFQEASSKSPLHRSIPSPDRHGGNLLFPKTNGAEALRKKEGTFGFWPPTLGYHFANPQYKLVKIHDPVIDGKLHKEKEQDDSHNGCRLFGFPLVERIPERNLLEKPLPEKPLPVSPSSTAGNLDVGFSASPMPAKPVGCSCIEASSLYALCAAPF
ncbi:auxin response factor 2-like isoform X2 [Zingiber officinale]|uniref:auxin response factor 2-like isoform X2 n=1 Tax=Zingiber officinale TaxID=94328 RepID=UPI001C4B5BB7|nr:auxin response factor 2-like isoform X2 [Zingiber officinale]